MKHAIITLAICLLALTAQAQTDYEIEQRLDGRIVKMQINRGWKVNLIPDTANAVVIHTPCEYYFAEGNEPNICRLMPDGTLAVWENRTMPQGTRLDIHYREPFESLYLHPEATVASDRLLLRDTHQTGHYGDIDVKHDASLQVRSLRCNGFLSIEADSNANVRVDTVRAGYLMLWSQHEATLWLDSIEAKKVDYRRNPRAHDKLWTSNPSRNIKVKTRNRWFIHGFKQLDNTIGIAWNSNYNSARYNSPYDQTFDITVLVGLKTNIVPINERWGLSLGFDFGIPFIGLQNNSTLNGRLLQIDTVSPGANRQHSMMNMYIGVPVRIHYRPRNEVLASYFGDLHLGLEPRWTFYQHYLHSQLGPDNHWTNASDRVKVYNPLQIRADLGFRIYPFSAIEFNFYADLLPTYRKETGMGKVHTFGFQIRF